jgi:hypothetical protein
VSVRAKGERLGPPSLPVATLPVTVQLLAGDGTCGTSTYDDVGRNDDRRLEAKGS